MLRQTWSGRRGSNPRLSPWQGDALPLSHSRLIAKPPDNGVLIPTTGWAVRDSNSHGLRQRILSPPCLPISATAHNFTREYKNSHLTLFLKCPTNIPNKH